jgi:hypothetical protein
MISTTTQSFRRLDRSLRLSFRFAQQEISLFDRRELEMKPLPSQDLAQFAPEERSGFWIEVQDARRRAIYRRAMPHPLLSKSEGRADEEPPRTVIWTRERGAFAVVVPNLRDGADLVLFGSPTDQPDISQPASEILRVSLRERRTPPGHRHEHHGEERS